MFIYDGILLFFAITMPIVVHSWSINITIVFHCRLVLSFEFFFLRCCVCLKHILLLHSQPLLLFLPNGIIIHFAFVFVIYLTPNGCNILFNITFHTYIGLDLYKEIHIIQLIMVNFYYKILLLIIYFLIGTYDSGVGSLTSHPYQYETNSYGTNI